MPTQRVGDTVVKTYRDDLRWQWGREVAFLRLVDGLRGFPNIVAVDDHSVTTAYAGEAAVTCWSLTLTAWRDELSAILKTLSYRMIRHRDITQHNLLWSPSRGLTLIDFGWSCWDWEPDTPVPPPDVMKPGMYRPDWEQAAEVLAMVNSR